MSIAVFNAPIDKGPATLADSRAEVVVRLKLPRGNWAVFGKVCVSNFDGEARDARAQLATHEGAEILDRTGVRIPGGHRLAQCLSVIGSLNVPGDSGGVHIACSTFNGEARDAQLIAVRIDELRPSRD